MQFSLVLVASVAIPLVAGYLVAPPAGSTPAPETTEDCSAWVVVVDGDTCASVIAEYDIPLAFFEAMVRIPF